jgi:hypothetical protein
LFFKQQNKTTRSVNEMSITLRETPPKRVFKFFFLLQPTVLRGKIPLHIYIHEQLIWEKKIKKKFGHSELLLHKEKEICLGSVFIPQLAGDAIIVETSYDSIAASTLANIVTFESVRTN